jgi:hypothetical protein
MGRVMVTGTAMGMLWREGKEEEDEVFRLSVVTSPLLLIKSGGGGPSG